MKRTLIAFIIIMLSVFYAFGQTASAPEGSGTEGDPYKISSLDELYWIAEKPERWNYHYVQVSDIDASATREWFYNAERERHEGWKPIGNSEFMFTGTYNASGHTIDSLYIYRPDMDYIGLFGYIVHPAVIKNLSMTRSDITGNYYVGSIAGRSRSVSEIARCYHTGNVQGSRHVGGLIGYATYTHIREAYNTGNVKGRYDIGGLIGEILTSQLTSCYNTGTVTAEKGRAGGLTAVADGSSVSDSYNSGNIQSPSNKNKGGLAAFSLWSDFSASYWDTEVNGLTESAGGEGRAGKEMTYPYADNTFEGWNFKMRWAVDDKGTNNGYPYLRYLPEGLLRFSITDKDNAVIPGARIDIFSSENMIISSIFSDKDGYAEKELIQGEYTYQVDHNCYARISEKIVLSQEIAIRSVLMPSEHSIIIRLDENTYQASSDLHLKVWQEDREGTIIADMPMDIDKNNEFETELPCGEYELAVFDNSGCSREYSTRITVKGADMVISAVLESIPYKVKFDIYDGNNRPLNSARIALFDQASADYPIQILTTVNGSAETDMDCGLYSYIITHDTHQELQSSVLLGERPTATKKGTLQPDHPEKREHKIRHRMASRTLREPAEERAEVPSTRRPDKPDTQTAERYRQDDVRGIEEEPAETHRDRERDRQSVKDIGGLTGTYTGSR